MAEVSKNLLDSNKIKNYPSSITCRTFLCVQIRRCHSAHYIYRTNEFRRITIL